MNFVLIGKAKQVFATLKLAAERSPELSRTCPFDPKARCNVPIAEPCCNCKVWQTARAKAHEERMAEKRAEAQALRKAFHIPLPSFEEIGSPIEEDTPATVAINAVVEKPPVEATEQASEAGKQPEKPKRDPATIKNFGDLYDACAEDWPGEFKVKDGKKIDTRKAVWKEAGVTSQEAINELPSVIYQRIAAIRNTPRG